MLSRLLQSEKAASPILVTESGIAIFLRLPHLQNAPAPMLVTESGMLTAVRLLHSKKALSLILVLNNTSVKSIAWHFYWSQASNSGGPSRPLRRALEEAGIKIVEHFRR